MRFCSVCGARFSNDVRFCPHDGQPLDDLPEPAEPEVDPLLGQVLDGRYRIDEILGEGGMGVVYLATHVALNKRMALKVLQGDMAKDETVVARFIQEAQSSSAIGHPNIIDISDFGRLPDGTAFFVMELLEGESLTQLIQRGRMTIAEVVHVGEQIASALGAAHERGIVHRDLKPDNVQLIQRGNDDRFVKVLDFGIAKVGGASSKLTKTGMIFGTPHYMSPEQAAGQSVDARADIYALGVILYEMCTGSVPFDGDTFMGILSKHMFEEPPRPSELDAGSCPLEPVVMRALAKKPEDRYPTMEALITDLRRVRDGGSVEAAPAMGAAASPLGDLRGSMPELPSSRTPLVALGVLAGLLGLGGLAGAWFALSKKSPEDAQATHAVTPVEPPPAAAEPASPPPDPATTPPTPTDSPEPVLVRIESDPPGAAVLVDQAVVGNTPLELPRPEEGSRQVELRVRGYEPRVVSLSPASGESIRATLERREEERPRRSRRVRTRRPVQMVARPTQMADPPAMATPNISSEVVDPWAQ